MSELTWEELKALPASTEVKTGAIDGERFIIKRGRNYMAAYLSIPPGHALWGVSFSQFPLQVHGGLTCSATGNKKSDKGGYWWFGWKYNLDEDACFDSPAGKQWLLEDIVEDIRKTIPQFKALCKLAEENKDRQEMGAS